MNDNVIWLPPVRRTLPTRRRHTTLKIVSRVRNAHSVYIGYWRFDDGPLGEVFISGGKSGSHMDALQREIATMISIALQYGIPLKELADNVQREPDGKPETVIGEVLDALVEVLKMPVDENA